MKDLITLTKDVERDLVIGIVIGVRHGRIDLKEAKDISKNFMASFPFESYKELFGKLYSLGNKHRVIRKVYIKHFLDYEKEETENILRNMRNFIKINEIDAAIKAAKGESYG